jgi:hypothetical protein
MKWPFFFKQKARAHDEAVIDRYKACRAAGRELNIALVKQLPKVAAPECGKKLGIVKAGTLILNNDDEIAVLYDYCLYHYRRDGKNAVERYLENTPPKPDSTEAALSQAMLGAYYSVFEILTIQPRQGASLRDLVSGETIDLLDISVSETGSPGIILAGRILPLADFNMSSGTLIPLPAPVYEDKIKPVVRKYTKSDKAGQKPKLSAGQEAAYTAEIIRIALHAGGEDNVFYTDIEN